MGGNNSWLLQNKAGPCLCTRGPGLLLVVEFACQINLLVVKFHTLGMQILTKVGACMHGFSGVCDQYTVFQTLSDLVQFC